MLRKWREKEAKKTENAMEDCVKRDLERVGGEWRTTAKDRSSWRLLIENTVKENGEQLRTLRPNLNSS